MVLVRGRVERGEVVYVTDTPIGELFAFAVQMRPVDRPWFSADKIHLYSIDPGFIEGVGWARGWEGPAVDALKSVAALA